MNQNQAFTVARLRDEFKLKPKKGVSPVRTYVNDYGSTCRLFRLSDCEPVPAPIEPSEKQKKGREKIGVLARMRGKKALVSKEAVELLKLDPVFLDTETTGLGNTAQIIEIAITDKYGKVLFKSRLKPTEYIEDGAYDVHGITEADLVDSPTWTDVGGLIEKVLSGRVCVIFNAKFDVRVIQQTAAAFEDPLTWWSQVDTRCAMLLAAKCYGANRYGGISLANAMSEAGVSFIGNAHNAAVDAKATADLIQAIANIHLELAAKLAEIEVIA